MAHFSTSSPVTSKSNFRLASVTKQFTAMSILQLIEKGELSFDTSLKDVFEDFPQYGSTLTMEHLLQHTSGIADYGPMGSMDLGRQFKDQDVLDFTMSLDTVDFPVGEKHEYSNTAYVVLTKVLEKVTGQTFREYLKENIFDPAGMDDTKAFEDGVNVVNNRAYGYTIEEAGVLETDQNKWSALLGDGGIYSNLEDLYKWDQILYTDKLLGQQYMDMAVSNHKTNDGKSMDYGYGWRLETYKGMDIEYHTGSSIGFRNILYRIPSRNFSAVILTNRDEGGEFSTLESVHKVVDVFF
jgi:CubicO group peptidase (beta-lactamase class C family)